MKQLSEANYLGTLLNDKGNPHEELKARISNTVVTWKKLEMYGKHSNCPIRDKS